MPIFVLYGMFLFQVCPVWGITLVGWLLCVVAAVVVVVVVVVLLLSSFILSLYIYYYSLLSRLFSFRLQIA